MNKNKTRVALSAINALLILLCVAGCVYILIANCGAYFTVTAIAEMLALIFSVMYYVHGYRKDAAKYYKLFLLFYAFTHLVEIFVSALTYDKIGVSGGMFTVVISMILYGNTFLLAMGKDLGKKVSLILCTINAVFYAIPVIGCAIPTMITYTKPQIQASSIILYCSWFVLSLNTLIMTLAKYYDKQIRKQAENEQIEE